MVKPEDERRSGFLRAASAERAPVPSRARLAWDAFLIAAGIFATASVAFALILRVGLPLQESIIAAAAICAVVSLLVGITVANCRASASRAEIARETTDGRLEAAAQASADAVVLCRRDARRTVLAAGERLEALSGYPLDHFVSGTMALSDLVEPGDAAAVAERIASALARGPGYRVTYGLKHLSGQVRQIEESGRLVPPEGHEVIAVLRDVGDKITLERSARQMRQELRLLRDRSPLGVLYFDGQGGIRGMNAVAARLLGVPLDASAAAPLFELLRPQGENWTPDSLPRFVSAAGVVLAAAKTQARVQAWLVPTAAGDPANRAYAAFLAALPQAEPSPAEPRLPFAASLEQEFSRARRFGNVFAVVVLAAAWRDEGGRPAAVDAQVIEALEHCCRSQVRTVDTVADLGGGVLGILLPEAGSRTARLVGERLRRAVLEMVVTRESTLVRAFPSVGATRLRTEDEDSQVVLKRALESAVRAGERGGNQVVVT
jgi:PAS domain-containing protein/GGDEF domain-containing protein